MSDNDEDIESAKKGCAGCLGCLAVFIIIPWLIFGPYYLLTSKTAEEAVKGMSVQDVLYTGWLVRDDTATKEKKEFVEKMCSTIKKETGLDLSMPIWEVLARNKKVEKLSLMCEFEHDGKGEYSMCYEIDGKQHRLKFIGVGASIVELEFGHALYTGNRSTLIDEIGVLYGMPKEGQQVLKEFINMQEGLPNN